MMHSRKRLGNIYEGKMRLKIDPELQELIPPLSEEERKILEANLKSEKNPETIVLLTWRGTLIDGHNRYEICNRLGIPFKTAEKEFEDRDAVKEWVINNQLGRRNIGAYTRADLALKLEGLIAARAKNNMSLGGGDKKSGSPLLANPIISIDTREDIAKKAHLSHGTIDKVKFIREYASKDEIQDLKKEEKSISEVFKTIKSRIAEKKQAEENRMRQQEQIPASVTGKVKDPNILDYLPSDFEKDDDNDGGGTVCGYNPLKKAMDFIEKHGTVIEKKSNLSIAENHERIKQRLLDTNIRICPKCGAEVPEVS